MTVKEKALWLQVHYHPYHLGWYLSNVARLEAIFKREYAKFLKSEKKRQNETKQSALSDKADKMMRAYRSYYHSDYQNDFVTNRRKTHERAMAIRNLWAY